MRCRGPALVGAGRLAGRLARAHRADLPGDGASARIDQSETGMERVPEELRAVLAAYDRLPKLQRAVLMLSYLEGVTNTEIAGIVDRSACAGTPRTRSRTRRPRRRPLLGAGRVGHRYLASASSRRSHQGLPATRHGHGPADDAGWGWPESLSERSRPCCCRSALCTGLT